ncbi:hypothetical protein DIPPA_28266, partial [Diplonema papillatum]
MAPRAPGGLSTRTASGHVAPHASLASAQSDAPDRAPAARGLSARTLSSPTRRRERNRAQLSGSYAPEWRSDLSEGGPECPENPLHQFFMPTHGTVRKKKSADDLSRQSAASRDRQHFPPNPHAQPNASQPPSTRRTPSDSLDSCRGSVSSQGSLAPQPQLPPRSARRASPNSCRSSASSRGGCEPPRQAGRKTASLPGAAQKALPAGSLDSCGSKASSQGLAGRRIVSLPGSVQRALPDSLEGGRGSFEPTPPAGRKIVSLPRSVQMALSGSLASCGSSGAPPQQGLAGRKIVSLPLSVQKALSGSLDSRGGSASPQQGLAGRKHVPLPRSAQKSPSGSLDSCGSGASSQGVAGRKFVSLQPSVRRAHSGSLPGRDRSLPRHNAAPKPQVQRDTACCPPDASFSSAPASQRRLPPMPPCSSSPAVNPGDLSWWGGASSSPALTSGRQGGASSSPALTSGRQGGASSSPALTSGRQGGAPPSAVPLRRSEPAPADAEAPEAVVARNPIAALFAPAAPPGRAVSRACSASSVASTRSQATPRAPLHSAQLHRAGGRAEDSVIDVRDPAAVQGSGEAGQLITEPSSSTDIEYVSVDSRDSVEATTAVSSIFTAGGEHGEHDDSGHAECGAGLQESLQTDAAALNRPAESLATGSIAAQASQRQTAAEPLTGQPPTASPHARRQPLGTKVRQSRTDSSEPHSDRPPVRAAEAGGCLPLQAGDTGAAFASSGQAVGPVTESSCSTVIEHGSVGSQDSVGATTAALNCPAESHATGSIADQVSQRQTAVEPIPSQPPTASPLRSTLGAKVRQSRMDPSEPHGGRPPIGGAEAGGCLPLQAGDTGAPFYSVASPAAARRTAASPLRSLAATLVSPESLRHELSGILPSPDACLAFGRKIASLWSAKPGTILDELLANLTGASGGAPAVDRVRAAAVGLAQGRGGELCGVELFALHLYTLAAPDVDALLGFDAVPAYGGEEWSEYSSVNPAVFRVINWALRTAYEQDETWPVVETWVKTIVLLMAISAELQDDHPSLSRGLASLPKDAFDRHQTLKAGDALYWAAPSSCAVDPEVSVTYIKGAAANATQAPSDDADQRSSVLFELTHVPCGVSLQSVSKYPQETEVLLPPLSHLVVERTQCAVVTDGSVSSTGGTGDRSASVKLTDTLCSAAEGACLLVTLRYVSTLASLPEFKWLCDAAREEAREATECLLATAGRSADSGPRSREDSEVPAAGLRDLGLVGANSARVSTVRMGDDSAAARGRPAHSGSGNRSACGSEPQGGCARSGDGNADLVPTHQDFASRPECSGGDKRAGTVDTAPVQQGSTSQMLDRSGTEKGADAADSIPRSSESRGGSAHAGNGSAGMVPVHQDLMSQRSDRP